MTLAIGIAGCTGRMGLTLIEACLGRGDLRLTAGSERPGFDQEKAQDILQRIGCKHMTVTSHATEFAEMADAIIDFTSPEATLANAKALSEKGGIHIVGTTGFTAAQQQKLEGFGTCVRIVQAGNFSLGVNLLVKLVEDAASALDERYDIELYEAHHKHKKDAPSGTALMLGRAAAKGRGVSLDDKKVTARDGMTGARKAGDIGFSVMRGGDIVGEHAVHFAGAGETLTLQHQGFNRRIYADGAIHAALWAANQKPGFYDMQDVLSA